MHPHSILYNLYHMHHLLKDRQEPTRLFFPPRAESRKIGRNHSPLALWYGMVWYGITQDVPRLLPYGLDEILLRVERETRELLRRAGRWSCAVKNPALFFFSSQRDEYPSLIYINHQGV